MADPALTDVPEETAEETLSPGFVRSVVDAVDRADVAQARELVLPLRPADLAELFELLRNDERQDLVGMLGTDLNPEVLSELDESVRDHVIELLDPKDIAAALTEMDSDD
ncbi:MAG: magnesium transporter, partial [Parvibaculum sp.]|nr:magnesium transporter [Parvibaculum sp.]